VITQSKAKHITHLVAVVGDENKHREGVRVALHLQIQLPSCSKVSRVRKVSRVSKVSRVRKISRVSRVSKVSRFTVAGLAIHNKTACQPR
jgi:hypothetical protein